MLLREDLIAHDLVNEDCEGEFKVNVVGFGKLVMAVCYRSPIAEQEEVDCMMRVFKKYSEDATIIMGDINNCDITAEGATS